MQTEKIQITNRHATFKLLPDLKEVCRPFFEKTGLKHFCYAMFDFANHKATVLTTTPLANRHLFLNNSVPTGKELIEGIHFLPTFKYSESRYEILQQFNIHQPLEIITRLGANKVEYLSFAVKAHDRDMTNFYFNHLLELKQFSQWFKYQAQGLMENAKCEPITIPRSSHLLNNSRPQDSRRLSAQELAVLRDIYNGLTAKQSAENLNLSRRTVEFYIQNIKNKMGCNTKLGLIKICLAQNLI